MMIVITPAKNERGNGYVCEAWSRPSDLSCAIARSSHARIVSLPAIVSESLAINVGDSKKIVEQRFYGEEGRSYMRFNFEENKLFAIVKPNLIYAVPISVDSSGSVKSSEERELLFGRRRKRV